MDTAQSLSGHEWRVKERKITANRKKWKAKIHTNQEKKNRQRRGEERRGEERSGEESDRRWRLELDRKRENKTRQRRKKGEGMRTK